MQSFSHLFSQLFWIEFTFSGSILCSQEVQLLGVAVNLKLVCISLQLWPASLGQAGSGLLGIDSIRPTLAAVQSYAVVLGLFCLEFW